MISKAEWEILFAEIQASFPNRKLGRATMVAWYADAREIESAELARQALTVLRREGREWAPTGGQLLSRAQALAEPEVDHGGAWKLVMDAVRKFGSWNRHDAMEWLREHDDAVAVAADRFGWKDLCLFNLDDLPTVRAQFREVYRGVRREGEERKALVGLPGGQLPVKLKQIEEGGA